MFVHVLIFCFSVLFSNLAITQDKREQFLKEYGQKSVVLGDLSLKEINEELEKIWAVLAPDQDRSGVIELGSRLVGRSTSFTKDNQLALSGVEGPSSSNGFFRNKVKIYVYDPSGKKDRLEQTIDIPRAENGGFLFPIQTKLNYNAKKLLVLGNVFDRPGRETYLVDIEKSSATKVITEALGITSLQNVEISPDGKFILFARQRTLMFWNIETSKMESRFSAFEAIPTTFAISPDSSLLAVSLQTGHTHILEVKTGKKVKTVGTDLEDVINHRGLNGVAFSPDQKQILSSDASGDVKLWDIETAKKLQTLKLGERKVGFYSEPLISMQFYPKGGIAFLGAGGSSGRVMLWNLRSDSIFNKLEFPGLRTMKLAPDASFMYVEYYDRVTFLKLK